MTPIPSHPPRRIVIIGRPNVGKSTLFNRLIGKKRALVHNIPGVTRDRIEQETTWWVHGKSIPISITDTGGLGSGVFSNEIQQQVHIALTQADLVLFVFDSQAGLTLDDEDLYRELQKSGLIKALPVIAVVNKVDVDTHEERIAEFFALGLDPILTVSSEHGRGMTELQQAVIEKLGPEVGEGEGSEQSLDSPTALSDRADPADTASENQSESESEIETESAKIPKIAFIGRPNVGKSTLVNALLGENRLITSPIAGTTSDSVDVKITLGGKPFLLIDTAGIRRKSKTEEGVEVLSVVQTKKTLERADLAILILDGESGTFDQDEKIGSLVEEAGCSIVLAVNKWDTQRKNRAFTKEDAAKRVRSKIAYLKYAPIVFTSGLRKEGLDGLPDLFEEILAQRRLKIPTHEFTEWVRSEATIHNPRNAKFYLCHQTSRRPITFVCHVNDPEKIHFSLKRHLVNALRERWGYMGSPIRMLFIEGKNRRSLPKRSPQKVRLPSPGKKKIAGQRIEVSR